MAKEYETADFEAALSLANCTAEVKEVEADSDIWKTAASVPPYLRHPAFWLEFQTWPKDSYSFRATCKQLHAGR